MKKGLIILCLIMFALPVFAESSIYPDVKSSSPYYQILSKLYGDRVMIGYPDGTFKPNQPATRAEYSEVITKALKLDKKMVVEGVEFYDLPQENPYYNYMQIALYYDFITVTSGSKYIYPNGTIIRKYAIIPVVNYLNDEFISLSQAKNILGKYSDRGTLRADDLIDFAKADAMGLIPVTTDSVKIDATKPLTRIDLAVLAYNILNQDVTVYKKTIDHIGTKKKGIGSKIKNSYVEGDYGIIPVQTEIPIRMKSKADSQKSQLNDVHQAVIPWNLVTKEKYLLIKSGSTVELKVADVEKRKFLIRNGRLRLESTTITTPYKQTAIFPAVLEVNDKIGLGNKIFKFKRIKTTKSDQSYLKLLKDVKVDLTTGQFTNEKL